MKTQPTHLTRAQLQDYLDETLGPEQTTSIADHLKTCHRCNGAYEELLKVHHALGRLPVQSVAGSFTDRVLAEVGISRLHPGLFRFLVYLPSLVGMLLVVGAMAGAYVLAAGSGLTDSSSVAGGSVALVEQMADSAMRTLMKWVTSMGSSGALAISAFALGLLVLLALGDLLPAAPVRRDRRRARDAASR